MSRHGAMRVAGTMSGTSLDGVDAAIVETDGLSITGFGPSAYRPYSQDERDTLRAALGRWPGEEGVEAAAEIVETAHAEVLSGLGPFDAVGFHGQTLAHDPGGRGTHQAGDGNVLAEVLPQRVPVVWDFRSNDVQLGGQGAPLAPAFHHALAVHVGAEEPLAFLNLGGVGNLTWVDPRIGAVEEPGAVLAFDTGPANAPVDDLMRQRLGRPFDEGGALAISGEPDEAILSDFLSHPYFFRMPPKSLDRNDFPGLVRAVERLSDADAAATLTAAAALAVLRGAEHFPAPVTRLLVTGGGRLNPALMEMIAGGLENVRVEAVEAAGLDGDMLEAQAFGHLAVRVLRGLPTSFPGTTGVRAAVGGGQVARPAA
ncbi:anhydro-N-acetylmuramic acid kinase [Tropicimonas sp. IMCC34011]|uniref:anhydro-N-acetylmuramic acid kinase n=1 Tax=Tropicimonas sp. IMCC34011 TaxID=2248759 RepID=UPI000E269238|nr:anhydro-N-acetylmuramic acid kinase [Tropicimonas sp. IMCC34011]